MKKCYLLISILGMALLLILSGCTTSSKSREKRAESMEDTKKNVKEENKRTIYLAGGCFWGVEAFMKQLPGIYDTEVGYANGTTEAPTYEEVCTGSTGHAETVKVSYDISKIDTEKVLKGFFKIIDPTIENRQGNDVGSQYRTGIYYTDTAERKLIDRIVEDEQKNTKSK